MTDVSNSLITLNNPLITLQEKHFFLKNYVSPEAVVAFDVRNNTVRNDIDIQGAHKSLHEKLLNRVGEYLKNGTVSIGTVVHKPFSRAELYAMLKNTIDSINIRFDMYVRSNKRIMQRLQATIENGKQEFQALDNKVATETSSIDNGKQVLASNVENLFDTMPTEFHAHQYQEDFVRLCRQRMLWINAFATGLGKTSTALLTVKDQHERGLKKRTLFVVPKSVLAKWYAEAVMVYGLEVANSCFFVNLVEAKDYARAENSFERKQLVLFGTDEEQQVSDDIIDNLIRSGKMDYLAKSVPEQLDILKFSTASLVFMSHEDFYRLKLKPQTVEQYIVYQKKVDAEFARSEYADNASFGKKIEAMREVLEASPEYPHYFEDYGFDSMIVDEMHIFKNAKTLSSMTTVKYLSIPPVSKRGVDVMAKTHLIRQSNPNKDGVVGLTATPLTNSPLEIYSMLSIVLGEYMVNRFLGISSVKDFVSLFCIIENQPDYGVDGDVKIFNMFKGFHNLKLLRELLAQCVCFLRPDDEEVSSLLKLPEKIDKVISCERSKFQQNTIAAYTKAYQTAKELVMLKQYAVRHEDWGVMQTFEKSMKSQYVQQLLSPIAKKFNEDIFLIGSPFNFIRKMERLILDEDLNEKATVVLIDKAYEAQALQAIKDFNAKRFKHKEYRLNPHTDTSAVFKTTVDDDTGKTVYEFYSMGKLVDLEATKDQRYSDIVAYLMANEQNNISKLHNSELGLFDKMCIVLDTVQYNEQSYFFKCLYKHLRESNPAFKSENDMLDVLDFNWSNKVRACLEAFQYEHTHSRTDRNKQLLFCDYLGIHYKLRFAIAKLTGCKLSEIEIITGQTNNDNDSVQKIQNSFNSDNGCRYVIGNQKIEMGVDLQVGTQATHNLTIGWTPDSETQRNGRSVRQGNPLDFVTVYNYEMGNTFDRYKRSLVNSKFDWIEAITNFGSMFDSVYITEMLSREEQEKMIDLLVESDGADDDLLANYQEQLKQEREDNLREDMKRKQEIYLDMMVSAEEQSSKSDTSSYLAYWLNELFAIHHQRCLAIMRLQPNGITDIAMLDYSFDAMGKLANQPNDVKLDGYSKAERDALKMLALTNKHLIDMVNNTLCHLTVDQTVLQAQGLQYRGAKEFFIDHIGAYLLGFGLGQKTDATALERRMMIKRNELNNIVSVSNDSPLNQDVSDMQEINKNIKSLAKEGFLRVSNERYAFYPKEMANHISDVFRISTGYLYDGCFVLMTAGEVGAAEMFEKIERTLNAKDINGMVSRGNMLNRLLVKNYAWLFRVGKTLDDCLQYPVNNRFAHVHIAPSTKDNDYSKLFAVLPLTAAMATPRFPRAKMESMKSQFLERMMRIAAYDSMLQEEDCCFHVIYPNSERYAQILQVVKLIELYYVSLACVKHGADLYVRLNDKKDKLYFDKNRLTVSNDTGEVGQLFKEAMETAKQQYDSMYGDADAVSGLKLGDIVLLSQGHAPYPKESLFLFNFKTSDADIKSREYGFYKIASKMHEVLAKLDSKTRTQRYGQTGALMGRMEGMIGRDAMEAFDNMWVCYGNTLKGIWRTLSDEDKADLIVQDMFGNPVTISTKV